MTCTKNCTHQPCPAPMACGVGSYPVIDESLLRRPLEARSQPDDMTYSGAFNGADIPLYQDNSDGSDPHEAPFGWLDRIREQAINGALVVAIWVVVAAVGGWAGYFVAKLNF